MLPFRMPAVGTLWPVDSIKLEVKDPLATHRNLLTRYTDSDMHNMLGLSGESEVRRLALLLAGSGVPAGAGARPIGPSQAAHR